ncbi:predicted protein [Naegleria gruberi]|uniref:Predicted protein n=1 Tax=Naegleria gruberi TaxID=5762 RepID=D2VR52_NAEGR|nr:uncharacterized protein NAEGRDRAFT_71464 [Naegleria gruberi]EFC40744.1 predicted protein [Naegleria gruberi]|eukprot:XP_002673488.1 predicted protein [Naegleria gruberi strain NEG-M]
MSSVASSALSKGKKESVSHHNNSHTKQDDSDLWNFTVSQRKNELREERRVVHNQRSNNYETVQSLEKQLSETEVALFIAREQLSAANKEKEALEEQVIIQACHIQDLENKF